MIINALCEHYDVLAADVKADISRPGYQKTEFHYTAVITEDGRLMALISHVVDKKMDKPSSMTPISMKVPGIGSSPVCDNMQYIFGADDGKGKGIVKFNAAKELHLRLFANAASREAKAVYNFFTKWNPLDIPEEVTQYFIKGETPPGNVAFKFPLDSKYFHECEEIRQIWIAENNEKTKQKGEQIAQCAITGEMMNIAMLHTQLSGVKGAQSTGASLICFNKSADESYNLKQSYNARVSEAAMFKYTTALQWLLKSKENKLYVGDDTCVFWANSLNHERYEQSIALLLSGVDEDKDDNKNAIERKAEIDIKAILKQGAKGIPVMRGFDPHVRFYILGLAPNAGRVSVRYFYRNSFAGFCDRIKQYYDETQIIGNTKYIKIGSLLYGTVNTNSKDKKINPLLGGAVMRAVLSGGGYPQLLFNQTIMRVRAEQQVTQARAAAIKAYLIRNKEEVVSPMLNELSNNPAYVLGRVFAILEMIQKNSVEGKLNATIKDKYFASACANPALVFPTLLKLTQHHLAKIGKDKPGLRTNREKELGGCLGMLDGELFPKTQNMDNQGRFILGYYQQTQKLYEKKNKEEDSNGSD
jgi:CRISPR-associated protein Csd1